MDKKIKLITLQEYVSIIYGTSRGSREATRLLKELRDNGYLQFVKQGDRLCWCWQGPIIEGLDRFQSHSWQVWDLPSREENLEALRRISTDIDRASSFLDEELPF